MKCASFLLGQDFVIPLTVHYKQGHFTLHDLKLCTNVTAEHSVVSVGSFPQPYAAVASLPANTGMLCGSVMQITDSRGTKGFALVRKCVCSCVCLKQRGGQGEGGLVVTA